MVLLLRRRPHGPNRKQRHRVVTVLVLLFTTITMILFDQQQVIQELILSSTPSSIIASSSFLLIPNNNSNTTTTAGTAGDNGETTTATTTSDQQREQQQQEQQPNITSISTSTSTSTTKSDYAYVFLLGSIDLDLPKYRNYLYSMYVAIYLLNQYGSSYDVIVYYGMIQGSRHDDLPPNELAVLQKLHPRLSLKKLPQSTSSFYNIQLNKFRILELTQYKRILFMDADVMPLANLDYYFEYSDNPDAATVKVHSSTQPQNNKPKPPFIHENFVVRGKNSPSNGGFFMLRPREGDLQHINQLIQTKESVINNGNEFDEIIGWGRPLEQPWYRGINKNPQVMGSKKWNFPAASGDQGLLYYWMAVVQKQFTVFLADKTGRYENWNTNVTAATISINNNTIPPPTIFPALTNPYKNNENTPNPRKYKHWPLSCDFPLPDVVHYIGGKKPWYVGCNNIDKSKNNKKFKTPVDYWCHTLHEINTRFNANINISAIKELREDVHPKVAHDPDQEKGLVTNIL